MMRLLLVEKGLDADESWVCLLIGSSAVDVVVIVDFSFLWKRNEI